jgi:hypothetical protein
MDRGPELVRNTASNSFTPLFRLTGSTWSVDSVLDLGSDVGVEFLIGASRDPFLHNLTYAELDHSDELT